MLYNKTNKQDELIATFYGKGTLVELESLKASNVIGKGGWHVGVTGTLGTKTLNYNSEAKAIESFQREVAEILK